MVPPAFRPRPLTIVDLAREAKVGIGTASRALRRVGYVKESTRQRVLETARRLNYVPQFAAASLRGRPAPLVGVVSYFHPPSPQIEIVWGAAHKLNATPYHLMMVPQYADDTASSDAWLIEAMEQNLLVGLIVVSRLSTGPEVMRRALERGVTIVTIEFRVPGASSVESDNRLGGDLAATHLAGRAKRFMCVRLQRDLLVDDRVAEDRPRGFVEGLRRQGIGASRVVMLEGRGYSPEEGFRLGKQLSIGPFRPLGIFCALGDLAALGIYRALRARGLKEKKDYCLVGYDGLSPGRLATPRLTTVDQRLSSLGTKAAAIMLASFQKKKLGQAHITLRPQLTKGETS